MNDKRIAILAARTMHGLSYLRLTCYEQDLVDMLIDCNYMQLIGDDIYMTEYTDIASRTGEVVSPD
ncbi:MAG: hypothetical protein AB2754_15890 [Candidatus Thiodiazotropha endolucinida]